MTMDAITIYTDGAASGNPGPGGYGVVLLSGLELGETALAAYSSNGAAAAAGTGAGVPVLLLARGHPSRIRAE